jgi:hypothetical protein
MMKKTPKVLAVSPLLLLLIAISGQSQSPQKTVAEPVGEIIANGAPVSINGTPVPRGSTVFNGNEIRTGDASAFVRLTSEGGVLSIAPGSAIKITREQGKIVAQVLKGSVTVRSPLASMVIAPDRVVNSDAANLYTVSVSDSGTLVKSLLKSVVVQAADGVVQTIAAQATGALGAAMAPDDSSKPHPQAEPPVTDRGENCFISVLCERMGTTLTVMGKTSCKGQGVGGVRVTLRIFFSNRAPSIGPLFTTTKIMPAGAVGLFEYPPITNPNVAGGGVAEVIVNDCGMCRDRPGGGTAGNRCYF